MTKFPAPQAGPRKYEIQYLSVLQLGFLHLSGLYGLYLGFTSAIWFTILFNAVLHVMAIIGVMAGAHRLWCHRAYKARLPLQVLLMLFHTLSFQDHAVRWARDHRYYLPLATVITFMMPTLTPMYWGENFVTAFNISSFRLIAVLNTTFLVNSAAHTFGNKPYDANISPTQSIPLSLATLGECFHNYHHVFPFDYRTGELGNNYINFMTKLIDFFAWIGWAYDLRTASGDMIMNRAKRTGDGTDLWGNQLNSNTDEPCVSGEENGIFFVPLALLVTFIFPISTPILLWGETLTNAFHISFLRLICSLHAIFLVNSAAHKFGYKPYDAKISSSQSAFLSWVNLGESYHNYHHVFPFDYRAGEFGNNYLNMCAKFIDFFAWIGWAYDLKTASDDMIMKRAKRSGDGTDLWGKENKTFKEMPEVDEDIASFNDMY